LLQRRCEPTGHRQHVDDGTTAVAPQDWSEGARHGERAIDVDLHLFPHGVCCTFGQHRFRLQDAGIVDQQSHVAAIAGRGSDILGMRDIQFNGNQPRVVDQTGIARAGIDPRRTCGEQRFGVGLAEAPVGPGDERDAAFDPHLVPCDFVANEVCGAVGDHDDSRIGMRGNERGHDRTVTTETVGYDQIRLDASVE
jgi:hypothetical protein